MHAVVVNVEINDPDAARKGLEDIVPTIREAPGFVAGYWVRIDDRHGTSVVIFETEDQARAGAPPAGGTAPGVTMTGVSVGEVLASA